MLIAKCDVRGFIMPSRPTLTLANCYTLIVESENPQNTGTNWRNTWDIYSSTGAPAPGAAIINALVAFHQANLRTECDIAKLTLRNWSQGPQPFAARPFIWEQFLGHAVAPGLKTSASPAGYGSEASGTQQVPGSTVLFAKRTTGAGSRATNMFMRGILDDGDVYAYTGGKPLLLTAAVVNPTSFNTVQNHFLSSYLTATADPRLIIVHVGNHYMGPPFASSMDALEMVNVSENKLTRKNKR